MIYVQEFDARPGISEQQMKDMYMQLVAGWLALWPTNKFMGLFARQYALGPGPHFMAIWELPTFSAFDEWRSDWPGFDDNMQEWEDNFWGSVVNVNSRVMRQVGSP